VKQGIALLDAKVPGWRDKIDVTRLRMSCPSDCIIGQLFEACDSMIGKLYGSYEFGLRQLGIADLSLGGEAPRFTYGFTAWGGTFEDRYPHGTFAQL